MKKRKDDALDISMDDIFHARKNVSKRSINIYHKQIYIVFAFTKIF